MVHTVIVVDTDTGDATPFNQWPEVKELRAKAKAHDELFRRLEHGNGDRPVHSKYVDGGIIHYHVRHSFEHRPRLEAMMWTKDSIPSPMWRSKYD